MGAWRRTVRGMELGIPESFWPANRRRGARQGAEVASLIVQRAFPPHPEDPHGAIAVQTVQDLSRAHLAVVLRNPDIRDEQLRWWMEGFVCGYAHHTAEAIRAAADLLVTDPLLHVNDMSAHAVDRMPVEMSAKIIAFFDMVASVLHGDETGVAWAADRIFVSEGGDLDSASLGQVCGTALMTCCGAWQLYLLATAS